MTWRINNKKQQLDGDRKEKDDGGDTADMCQLDNEGANEVFLIEKVKEIE